MGWPIIILFCNCFNLCIVVALSFSKARCVKRDCQELIREQMPTLPPLTKEPYAWLSPPKLSRAPGQAQVEQAPDDGVVVAQLMQGVSKCIREKPHNWRKALTREEKDCRNEKRRGKRKGEQRGNRTKEGRKVEELNRPSRREQRTAYWKKSRRNRLNARGEAWWEEALAAMNMG